MTINLSPEDERIIQERLASGRFHTAEEVIHHALLADVVAPGPRHQPPPPKQLSDEHLKRVLNRMVADSDRIPSLPDEAFSRESLYNDHD